MWMWFNCLADETKMEPMDFYQHYAEIFLKHLCTYDSDGVFVSGGTSTLKIHAFADFLTKIQIDAMEEFNCRLLSREDKDFREFQNQYDK